MVMREDLDLNVPKTALSVSASSPPLSTSPHPSSFSFSPPNLPIISPTEIPSPSSLSPYDRSNDFHRSWARQSFELWKLTKYLLNSITYLKQDFSDPLFLVFVQTAEIHQKALLHHHTRRPYDPYTTGSPYDPTELSSFHLLVIAALQPPVFSTEVLTSASQHCSARQAKIEELHMCLLDAEDAVRRLEFRGAARSEVQQARRLIDTRRTALIELLGSTPLFPIVTTLGLPSTSSAHDLIALGSTDTKVDDSWHSAIGDQNKAAHLDDDTPALGGNGLSDQGPVTAGDADGDDALKAASAGKDAQDIPLGIPFIHGRICSLGSMDANYISSTAADTSSIGCQVEGVHASSAIDDDIPSELAVEDRTAAPSQDPSVSALFPIHCNIAASVSGLANSMVDFDSMDCSARTSATSVSTSVLADASTLHRSPCTRLPPEDTPTFRWADDTDTTLHAHALGTNPASAVAEDHPRVYRSEMVSLQKPSGRMFSSLNTVMDRVRSALEIARTSASAERTQLRETTARASNLLFDGTSSLSSAYIALSRIRAAISVIHAAPLPLFLPSAYRSQISAPEQSSSSSLSFLSASPCPLPPDHTSRHNRCSVRFLDRPAFSIPRLFFKALPSSPISAFLCPCALWVVPVGLWSSAS